LLLPNANQAVVEESKMTDDLFSESHPIGRHKAHFFKRLGFKAQHVEALKLEILQIARKNPVTENVDSAFGNKYVVCGSLEAPSGKVVSIKTVWIIEKGSSNPRFVTAYPNE